MNSKLLVHLVIPDSPADKVGIKKGDFLVEYNGIPVNTIEELRRAKEMVSRDSVKITIERGNERSYFIIPKGQIGVYLKEQLPEIEPDEDAVILPKIGKLDWEVGMSNSFIAALVRIVNYLGIERDYTYFMGVSGAAFRIHFHKDWCPSSPDATVGFSVGEESLKAMGFDYKIYILNENPKEEIRREIIESIRRGVPVIAIDLIGVPEWGLITGYQKNGEEFFCRTYFDRREGYEIADKFPWIVFILLNRGIEPDDRKNYINSFKIASILYSTHRFEEYYSGVKAIKYWIDQLEKEKFTNLPDDRFRTICLANAWIYDRLKEDRKYAALYLRSIVGHFPEIKVDLTSLEEIYREVSNLMEEVGRIVIYPTQLSDREDWSEEMREKEIDILKEVLKIEKKARKLWKKINASWD